MKLLKFLMQYSAGRTVWLALLAALVSGAVSVGFPALITTALNRWDLDGAAGLGWAFLAVSIAVPATRLISQYLLVSLAQEAAFNLRLQFTRKLAGTSLARQETLGKSRLLASVSQDLPALTTALTMLPAISVNTVLVLGCLAYLGWLSWPLLLSVTLLIVVGSWLTRLPVRLGRRKLELSRTASDTFFELFRSFTEGAKEIKVHRPRRLALISRMHDTADRLKGLGTSSRMIFDASAAFGQLLFFFILGLVLFVLADFQELSREILIGYTVVLFFIKAPMQGILENLPDLSRAGVAMEKLEELGLALGREDEDFEPDAFTAPAGWRRLELAGVTHTYRGENQDDDFTLGPVDLEFRPGELVFLVGGNGSGKTTLAKVLAGLYAPDEGEVRLDGETVDQEGRDRYRQLFSVVFSDFFLFDDLLGLGASDLDERAGRYLGKLHLDRKVGVEEGRLSTTALSQGQRKRLALLTAYLEDRDVYLFDEWAADQDPAFKEVFYRELLPELKASGKTVFVISHDDRYYGVADRIVKLENGRVVRDEAVAAPEGGDSTRIAAVGSSGARTPDAAEQPAGGVLRRETSRLQPVPPFRGLEE
ncbi:MAG TPA: cyclic peptide export ABC transporter [Thermoanaerobaculia bacterium]|nr:cyclic peptide export ABC transporter [Thermoanaerobaculia bacterium]